jgi:competence protein ComEA
VTSAEPPSPAAGRGRLGLGAAVVVVIIALGVTVGIGVLRGSTAPVETVVAGGTETEETGGPSVIYVHVSGAVAAPGLYVLETSARVVDAVAAAGGLTPDADDGAVNLARPLSDGEQLQVPVEGAVPEAAPAPAGDGRVNLNTADVGALDTLPRIGEAMAQRIVDWREANGRFTSIEDLLAVPGIGDKMLQALRDLVTV